MAKLLITTASGPDDATRASIGFHIALNGAAKNHIETSITPVIYAAMVMEADRNISF